MLESNHERDRAYDIVMVKSSPPLPTQHRHRKTAPRRSTRGFTIIEVMIVLMIVGLIMLIVFLAVPAVQRNARNHERRQAVQLIAVQMDEYRNNYGNLPSSPAEGNAFIDSYLANITKTYDVTFYDFSNGHSYMPPNDTIAIQFGHWCNVHGNGNNASDPIASAINGDLDKKNYVIWTTLEPNDELYCLDSYGA